MRRPLPVQPQRNRAGPGQRRRGSVVVLVMITLLMAAWGVSRFVERAYTELQAEARAIHADRLRADAYSALDTTLAVLQDVMAIDGSLQSPLQGWGDPFGYAGLYPPEGQEIRIGFQDETGKISLPKADVQTLHRLFEGMGFQVIEYEDLTDAILGWMRQDHVSSSYRVDARFYEEGPVPYRPPYRSPVGFSELAAIQVVRDRFFDEDGRPNDAWHQFVASVSLFDFNRPNINSAPATTLMAQGGLQDFDVRVLHDFLGGRNSGSTNAQTPYFQNAEQVKAQLGRDVEGLNLGTEIQVLRINVAVVEGIVSYRLSAVVEVPSGGTRRSGQEGTGARGAPANRPPGQTPPADQPRGGGAADQMNYPFQLLEIKENDTIPSYLAERFNDASEDPQSP